MLEWSSVTGAGSRHLTGGKGQESGDDGRLRKASLADSSIQMELSLPWLDQAAPENQQPFQIICSARARTTAGGQMVVGNMNGDHAIRPEMRR